MWRPSVSRSDQTERLTWAALCSSPLLTCSAPWWTRQRRSLCWSVWRWRRIKHWGKHLTADARPVPALTSSWVCPRVSRFRQVSGTSFISTSATTRSSFTLFPPTPATYTHFLSLIIDACLLLIFTVSVSRFMFVLKCRNGKKIKWVEVLNLHKVIKTYVLLYVYFKYMYLAVISFYLFYLE